MKLLIVIPAYNEEKIIKKNVLKTREFFKKRYKVTEFEIIIVNDGSSDNTGKISNEIRFPNVSTISYKENKGKGYAVKKGMKKSKGELILMIDADLATPLDQFDKIIKFKKNYDIIIGSRVNPKAKRKPIKKIFGKLSYLIVEVILNLGIKDTQCGFKLFKRKTLKIFKKQKIDGFGFDFEILYIANKEGYKIKEIPVKWIEKGDSKVKLKHYFFAFKQLLKVKKIH
ncbi:MAG: dolichyl-phosphate beta-glucosyltransferase [Candidatus Woesearchaeota archaeon]